MEWLFSWEVVSVVATLFIGIALGFVQLDDFRLAKLLFLLAAADAIGGIAMWGAKWKLPTWISGVLVTCLGAGIAFLLFLSLRYVEQKKQAKEQKPNVKVGISSRIIARIYARTLAPPPGETIQVLPEFQEIFYEWSVCLKADQQSTASLKADYLQEHDIFRVDPEGATTQRVPESPLGFKSPEMHKPSHYALIVKCDDLAETQPLTVTVRRSIVTPLADSDLIRLAYVRSATARIENPAPDARSDVERLNRQAKIIAQWKHAPRTDPLPIHPPTDIPKGWMQSVLEMWCQNEECKTMTMGNLVAEWNRLSDIK